MSQKRYKLSEKIIAKIFQEELFLYIGFHQWWTTLDLEEQSCILQDSAKILELYLSSPSNTSVSYEPLPLDFEGSYAEYLSQNKNV